MDNGFVERLLRSLNYQEVYLKAYEAVAEVGADIGVYLRFYNDERLHQALGYRMSRELFEAGRLQQQAVEEIRFEEKEVPLKRQLPAAATWATKTAGELLPNLAPSMSRRWVHSSRPEHLRQGFAHPRPSPPSP